jgi:hypothetical protein
MDYKKKNASLSWNKLNFARRKAAAETNKRAKTIKVATNTKHPKGKSRRTRRNQRR